MFGSGGGGLSNFWTMCSVLYGMNKVHLYSKLQVGIPRYCIYCTVWTVQVQCTVQVYNILIIKSIRVIFLLNFWHASQSRARGNENSLVKSKERYGHGTTYTKYGSLLIMHIEQQLVYRSLTCRLLVSYFRNHVYLMCSADIWELWLTCITHTRRY